MNDPDEIEKIVASLPEKMSAADIINLFIGTVEAYSFREDWPIIATSVGFILNEMRKAEAKAANSTHH